MDETGIPHPRNTRMSGGVGRPGAPPSSSEESPDSVGVSRGNGTKHLYTAPAPAPATQMLDSLYRAGVSTVYQLTLVAGIVLMPVALLASRLGVPVPVGDIVAAVGRAYESAA